MKKVKSSDRGDNDSYNNEKNQAHIPSSFAYKVVCVDNKFIKPVVLYRGKNAVYRFIEKILVEYDYCSRVIKKPFNKKLKKDVSHVVSGGCVTNYLMQDIIM